MLRPVSRRVLLFTVAVCFIGSASCVPASWQPNHIQPNDPILQPNGHHIHSSGHNIHSNGHNIQANDFRPISPLAEWNGSAVIDSPRMLEKRAVNENIFEDDDGGKSNNVDYIDFSNLYKDEVSKDGKSHEKFELEQNKNKKRMVKNRREKLKEKKKRKKKRKHKQSRFKRRDDDPTNLTANGGRSRPSTNLISLECEDRLHCLLRRLGNGQPDDKKLNKLFDSLTESGQKTTQLPISGARQGNKTTDVAAKKRPNYFGNFHLVIRIPKNRNLNELQNLTLITATGAKHQKELNRKLDQLQELIQRLTNQLKNPHNPNKNSYKMIGGNTEGINKESGKNGNENGKNGNENGMENGKNFDQSSLSDDRVEINANEEITRNGFDQIKANHLTDSNLSSDLNSKRLLCVKKPTTLSTFCYFAP